MALLANDILDLLTGVCVSLQIKRWDIACPSVIAAAKINKAFYISMVKVTEIIYLLI